MQWSNINVFSFLAMFAFQFLGKRTEIACKYLKMQLQ